jgi:two-component system, sensor histidine kinase and response regulator
MTVGPNANVKILLVDDLENNLLALSALLQRDGVELLTARSGPEALELLLAHSVALTLVDVQMPSMDGFELAELMRGSDRTRHVPIIFVTAGASDARRVFQGYESGAVDFLYKPIDPHILKSKVDVFVQLEEQKVALATELQRTTDTLRFNEMFTAMLGHDLRGPLSAIVMDAVLLERRTSEAATRKSAARMLKSAKRMSRMIVEMLDLARGRLAGGIPIRRQPADLKALVEQIIVEHRTIAPGRDIELRIEGTLEGEWDPDRCGQLVANLIDNATRHGAESSPVECVLDGTSPDAVTISVGNDGAIAPDLLPHIFDPFRSRDEYRAKGGGLGLGLYIVEQVAVAHGGQVSVASGEDDRTMFHVTLPRR